MQEREAVLGAVRYGRAGREPTRGRWTGRRVKLEKDILEPDAAARNCAAQPLLGGLDRPRIVHVGATQSYAR